MTDHDIENDLSELLAAAVTDPSGGGDLVGDEDDMQLYQSLQMMLQQEQESLSQHVASAPTAAPSVVQQQPTFTPPPPPRPAPAPARQAPQPAVTATSSSAAPKKSTNQASKPKPKAKSTTRGSSRNTKFVNPLLGQQPKILQPPLQLPSRNSSLPAAAAVTAASITPAPQAPPQKSKSQASARQKNKQQQQQQQNQPQLNELDLDIDFEALVAGMDEAVEDQDDGELNSLIESLLTSEEPAAAAAPPPPKKKPAAKRAPRPRKKAPAKPVGPVQQPRIQKAPVQQPVVPKPPPPQPPPPTPPPPPKPKAAPAPQVQAQTQAQAQAQAPQVQAPKEKQPEMGWSIAEELERARSTMTRKEPNSKIDPMLSRQRIFQQSQYSAAVSRNKPASGSGSKNQTKFQVYTAPLDSSSSKPQPLRDVQRGGKTSRAKKRKADEVSSSKESNGIGLSDEIVDLLSNAISELNRDEEPDKKRTKTRMIERVRKIRNATKEQHSAQDKERVRTENRERKALWRRDNVERNRDNDLRWRVVKRANKLYGEGDSEAKSKWVEEEITARKEKRQQRQATSTSSGHHTTVNTYAPHYYYPPEQQSDTRKNVVALLDDLSAQSDLSEVLSMVVKNKTLLKTFYEMDEDEPDAKRQVSSDYDSSDSDDDHIMDLADVLSHAVDDTDSQEKKKEPTASAASEPATIPAPTPAPPAPTPAPVAKLLVPKTTISPKMPILSTPRYAKPDSAIKAKPRGPLAPSLNTPTKRNGPLAPSLLTARR